MFLSVMKNKEAYESTLSIIMDDPDLELKEVKVEEGWNNEDFTEYVQQKWTTRVGESAAIYERNSFG